MTASGRASGGLDIELKSPQGKHVPPKAFELLTTLIAEHPRALSRPERLWTV